MAVRNRLVKLISEMQISEKRIITVAEIADATGISRPTLYQYLKSDVVLSSFKSDVIEGLCRYFKCDVGDLLYVDYGDHQTEAHP